MAMGEYHDMDNGRVCERVNVGWMQGYTGWPRNANSTRRIVSLLPDI